MTPETTEPRTLPTLLEEITSRYADRRALVAVDGSDRRCFTFAELAALVGSTRAWLRRRVRPGERVLICSTNTAEALVLMLACGSLGAVAIPVDLMTSRENLRNIVAAGHPVMIATTRDDLDRSLGAPVCSLSTLFSDIAGCEPDEVEPARLAGEELLFLFYTSGTTGTPKGVRMTHGNVVSNVVNVAKLEDLDRGDRLLTMAPLSHALGISIGLLIPWRAGNTVVLSTSMAAEEMLRIFHAEQITAIATVPLFLDRGRAKIEAKLRAQGKLETFQTIQRVALRLPLLARRLIFRKVLRAMAPWLRWVAIGGAALNPETELFWEAIGVQIIKGYGLTETFIATCSSFRERRPGSVGIGVPGQEIRIAEDGEIWLRGPNVMEGYDGAPEANAACFVDDWLRTGDVGRFDDDGHLYITGRVKNVVIGPSGLNIYPEDVEQVLSGDSRVGECVVVESPERPGRLWALIVPTVGGAELDDEALRLAVNERLSSHQRLDRIVVWPEADFPRTGSQKIRRNVVVEQLRAWSDRSQRAAA